MKFASFAAFAGFSETFHDINEIMGKTPKRQKTLLHVFDKKYGKCSKSGKFLLSLDRNLVFRIINVSKNVANFYKIRQITSKSEVKIASKSEVLTSKVLFFCRICQQGFLNLPDFLTRCGKKYLEIGGQK